MKLRVKWNPNPIQDLNALIDPKSPFYDEEFINDLVKKYGSVDNFKNSDDFKKLIEEHDRK